MSETNEETKSLRVKLSCCQSWLLSRALSSMTKQARSTRPTVVICHLIHHCSRYCSNYPKFENENIKSVQGDRMPVCGMMACHACTQCNEHMRLTFCTGYCISCIRRNNTEMTHTELEAMRNMEYDVGAAMLPFYVAFLVVRIERAASFDLSCQHSNGKPIILHQRSEAARPPTTTRWLVGGVPDGH